MATFKAVVRTDYKRSDGSYRVYIRITHKRAHKDRPTPFYVFQSQITKSGKLKDQMIIDKTDEKIKEYRDKVNKMGFTVDDIDLDQLLLLLDNSCEQIDFFKFWGDYINQLKKTGRDGTATSYKCVYNSFRNYYGEKPLYLSDMTSADISGYLDSISNLSDNTIVGYMGLLEAMYNRAKKRFNNEEAGIIVVKNGLFNNIELPQRNYKNNNVIKSIEDMQRIIDSPYSGEWIYDFSKDMFILSFVCFGTNMADWVRMKKSNYKDGILKYSRKKTENTSSDGSEIEIKVPEVGRIILDKYSGDKEWLIDYGNHSRKQNYTSQYIHYTFQSAGLEEESEKRHDIGKKRKSPITFYSNRHSMASFVRNVCKVDYITVLEMLNHAKPSEYRTTDAYIWKDYTPLWDANDKLLALFNWDFYLKQKQDKSK